MDEKELPKLGFQFKGSTKRKVIIEVNKSTEKQIIHSIEGEVIKGDTPISSNLLIIPLPKENVTAASKVINEKSNFLTADDIAAAELIAELNGKPKPTHSELLIASIDNTKNLQEKFVPILLKNQPTELQGLNNDDERFKMDISLRPNENDVKSDAYIHVPIDEFCAAMLRGMGWSGKIDDTKNNKYDLTPREYRYDL